jgi:hypothetical protein
MEEQTRPKTLFTFTKPVTSTYIQANALRFWRLEPDDGKLSSPVLRGGGRGDVFLLTRTLA